MNAYDFVHLALHALGGGIRGKTKLQKTMYFLGVLTDSLADLGYRPHYYGPYSADVAGAVDRLRSLGFADQTVCSSGTADPDGFEVARYDLRLNEAGKKVAESKVRANADLWAKLTGAVEVFKRISDLDHVKLSIAAKTYFMLEGNRGSARPDTLSGLAGQFGWAVTPEQVREAARHLQSVGLFPLDHPGETAE